MNNLRTNVLTSPKDLIVLFDNGYAEIADIDKETLEPRSFRPFTNKEILNIHSVFKEYRDKIKNNKSDQGYYFDSLLNNNIIELNTQNDELTLSWTLPPKIRKFIYYKQESEIYYPGLIFRFTKNSIRVYAYKGSKFKENSVIYRAPLPNIGKRGGLCFGNVNVKKLKTKNLTKFISKVEHNFFNSGFTHSNGGDPTKSPLEQVLKERMDTKTKFPSSEFKKSYKNFNDVINS